MQTTQEQREKAYFCSTNDLAPGLLEKLVSADGWRGENWTVDVDHARRAKDTLKTLRSTVMVG